MLANALSQSRAHPRTAGQSGASRPMASICAIWNAGPRISSTDNAGVITKTGSTDHGFCGCSTRSCSPRLDLRTMHPAINSSPASAIPATGDTIRPGTAEQLQQTASATDRGHLQCGWQNRRRAAEVRSPLLPHHHRLRARRLRKAAPGNLPTGSAEHERRPEESFM